MRAAWKRACVRNVSQPKMSCAVWWAVHAAICSLCPPVRCRWLHSVPSRRASDHAIGELYPRPGFARDGFRCRGGASKRAQIAAKTACRTRVHHLTPKRRNVATAAVSARARAALSSCFGLPSWVAMRNLPERRHRARIPESRQEGRKRDVPAHATTGRHGGRADGDLLRRARPFRHGLPMDALAAERDDIAAGVPTGGTRRRGLHVGRAAAGRGACRGAERDGRRRREREKFEKHRVENGAVLVATTRKAGRTR